MYNNIGKKIKGLAKIVVYAGISVCVIGGIATIFILSDNYYTKDFAFIGLIIALVGSLLCWLSGFFIYGFGELVDQTQEINIKLTLSENKSDTKEKLEKLKEWREKGLITEKELMEKLSSL
ncbi:MAG: hypothetical protein IJE93_10605 [Clostridia bacterium]|nr:hypothetical protein [Clostridia bacterium]